MPGQAVSDPSLLQEWDPKNSVDDPGFAAPPPAPVMPDWSKNKKLARYFRETRVTQFPTWLYNHKTKEAKLFQTPAAAAAVGVTMRLRTAEEARMYGGIKDTPVWEQPGDWKTDPPDMPRVYDPLKPEYGKEYQASPISAATSNRNMLELALPQITAAVVAALKEGGSTNPKNVDPKQWDEFLAFQAWQKTQEAVEEVTKPIDVQAEHEKAMTTTMALEGVTDEKAAWIRQAEETGVKIDKRWSLEHIKSEVEKAM